MAQVDTSNSMGRITDMRAKLRDGMVQKSAANIDELGAVRRLFHASRSSDWLSKVIDHLRDSKMHAENSEVRAFGDLLKGLPEPTRNAIKSAMENYIFEAVEGKELHLCEIKPQVLESLMSQMLSAELVGNLRTEALDRAGPMVRNVREITLQKALNKGMHDWAYDTLKNIVAHGKYDEASLEAIMQYSVDHVNPQTVGNLWHGTKGLPAGSDSWLFEAIEFAPGYRSSDVEKGFAAHTRQHMRNLGDVMCEAATKLPNEFAKLGDHMHEVASRNFTMAHHQSVFSNAVTSFVQGFRVASPRDRGIKGAAIGGGLIALSDGYRGASNAEMVYTDSQGYEHVHVQWAERIARLGEMAAGVGAIVAGTTMHRF